ncbi:TonB-dependent receptor [Segetibacter sp. 3557_3]|uniref:SusC/RagA family TonB-linked outer membrane protein n=1 Tax=Segetibacter sp. 3557_3 TaxID=2547429 RepID=UPI00105860EA|nr:TonB-dependent receptor [Segetibacter sp. 3557_3]TDH27764.1 TonB-dependent receptor [Segetibacter sp. 3557_3]
MKNTFLLCVCYFLLSGFLHAQNLVVTGTVIDDSSRAGLAGVSVVVSETGQGVSTDANGAFRIPVSGTRKSVSLRLTFVGYRAQTVNDAGASPLTIAMHKEQSSLDDVVVVGYTSVRRRDLTGSVSSVGARQLRDIPLSSAAEALTGRLAGVQVTSSEGSPGAEVVIRVRGGGSITQDNSPIYIVDGIQVENALNVISPQDIASVDVLKDASTTAIYGARGANGVVIITTKSGRSGKTQVTYNGSAGIRQIFKKMDVLKPYEFVNWQYERAMLNNDTATFKRIYGSTWDTLQNYRNVPFLDWQETMFGRTAGYQNHNVAFSGGNQNTTFNLSLTANEEEGILVESGFSRKLANFKLDHRASDRFRLGFNVRYINQTIRGAGTTASGTRQTNRLRHSIQYRPLDLPTAPPVDEFDEEYFRLSGQISNPLILAQQEYRRSYTDGVNLNGYLSYRLAKDLTFKTTFGVDRTNGRQNSFYGTVTGTARNYNQQPVVQVGQQNTTTLNWSNTLQYVRNNVGGKHDFNFLLGHEIYETNGNSLFQEVRFFPTEISPENALARLSLGVPPAGSTFQQPNPTSNVAAPNRIFSLFGQLNYTFMKRILATATLRTDRSTKFSYENGALVFPSGTLAWRFSQEEFMQNLKFINDAKVRIGYGVAGNNRIGDLLYLQLYNVSGQYALNHSILTGYAPAALANPNLRWERNVSQNIGLDLSFLRNRLQVTIDAYNNRGNELLLSVNIPPTSGYSQQLQNAGSTSNKGIEFQISATPVQSKSFSWTSNFNLAFNKNRVESLGPIQQTTRSAGWQGSDGADDYLVKVGEPIGLMYGFKTDGFYKIEDFNYNATTNEYTLKPGIPNSNVISGPVRPGSLKIRDLNGDGIINSDSDRAVIGNANPKFTGGWNNQFSYRNFDLSVFVNWVVGNKVYNANKIEWTDGSFPNLNLLGSMRDRWRNIDDNGNWVRDPVALAALNTNAKIWTPNNSNRFFLTDYAVESGSFLRVNNITLGYTIPTPSLQRLKISNLRVYGTVNNLATITNYTGFDPEVSTRRSDPLTPGVDFAGYPRSRTWVVGINVTF